MASVARGVPDIIYKFYEAKSSYQKAANLLGF